MSEMASWLTSVALFPQEQSQLTQLQAQSIDLIQRQPFVTATVNQVLRDCLDTRIEREIGN